MINWTEMKTTRQDTDTISKIANRYIEFHYSLGIPKQLQRSKLNLVMDLEAVHNEIGLRLEDLLNAPDGEFTHDMVGIQVNLNRNTGKLENCFLPRYSK